MASRRKFIIYYSSDKATSVPVKLGLALPRVSEVEGLTWAQVDLANGIVRLEAGETKNDEGRTVYLDKELQKGFKRQSDARKERTKITLVNSYSRLIERDKQKEIDPTMDGDPTYCKKIAADRTDRKGIIR